MICGRTLEVWLSMDQSWLIVGDLNNNLSMYEKKGAAPINHQRCALFRDVVNSCSLMDLGEVGSKFTWRRPLIPRYSHIFQRLDRAISNADWHLNHPIIIHPKDSLKSWWSSS